MILVHEVSDEDGQEHPILINVRHIQYIFPSVAPDVYGCNIKMEDKEICAKETFEDMVKYFDQEKKNYRKF